MNYTPEQPEPLVFFIDRSLGKKTIADALKQEGAKVHVHDDLFPADTEDERWLRRSAIENGSFSLRISESDIERLSA